LAQAWLKHRAIFLEAVFIKAMSLSAAWKGHSQEDWMEQLEQNVRTGYKTFMDGWQTASSIFQEHADLMNPTMCTCNRSCDKNTLVMPAVVADDEVAYPYSTNQASHPSPFSPRGINKAAPAIRTMIGPATAPANQAPLTSAANQVPASIVASATAFEEPMCVADERDKENEDVPAPPLNYMGNFGYYCQEFVEPLRPPSQLTAMTVNTAVRAAPWDQWVKPRSPQKAQEISCQTGSSLISKGGAGTSQVAALMQDLQPGSEASMKPHAHDYRPHAAQAALTASPPACEPASPPAGLYNAEANSAVEPTPSDVPPLSTMYPFLAESESPVRLPQLPPQSPPAREVEPKAEPAPIEPKPVRTKAKAEAKSVLAQSSSLKSSAAMALSGLDRKSALSVATPMTSSAAAALGGLGKVNPKRRGGSAERDSVESVVLGAPPASGVAPLTAIEEGSALTTSKAAASTPKPARSASRQGGSRSKGPDAKSVISGLNSSSSSASALLGPMLAGGQPKRRPARPEGADVASVI